MRALSAREDHFRYFALVMICKHALGEKLSYVCQKTVGFLAQLGAYPDGPRAAGLPFLLRPLLR